MSKVVEHPGDREMDAVGGGAIDVIEAVGGLAKRERTVERQRVARAAAVALGSDHGHLADRAERLGERRDAGGEVTVVVADQDAHLDSVRVAARDCKGLQGAPRTGGSGDISMAYQAARLANGTNKKTGLGRLV